MDGEWNSRGTSSPYFEEECYDYPYLEGSSIGLTDVRQWLPGIISTVPTLGKVFSYFTRRRDLNRLKEHLYEELKNPELTHVQKEKIYYIIHKISGNGFDAGSSGALRT